ncbi:hypothetical protein [Nitrosomonas sp.]|nr:hypothetical protein [Nitrosomonas sp.]
MNDDYCVNYPCYRFMLIILSGEAMLFTDYRYRRVLVRCFMLVAAIRSIRQDSTNNRGASLLNGDFLQDTERPAKSGGPFWW